MISSKVIISLTTYSKRINTVHLTLNTLFNQTYPFDRIILWLAEDEFTINTIPQELKDLQKKGLEISFCKDIKSYKKLIPTLAKYREDIIITFDDDAYYKKDAVEKLVKSYKQYPKCIHCLRGHKMKYDANNFPISYNQWEFFTQDFNPGLEIFPTGLGGVLYPPNCFYKDILNEELFMKLAPSGDDIWFKVMGLINGYPSKVVEQENNFYANVTLIDGTQDIALWKQNKSEETGNNLQITNIYEYYKNLINFDSSKYWEQRYKEGGNSGSGSYNRLAKFKADVLNEFINKYKITTLIEFGCGDGNNLSLYEIDNYTGIDVSNKAIEICKVKFISDKTKKFLHISKLSFLNSSYQLAISFDVIYHLIEDDVFDSYMKNLFKYANNYVIIYSSNKDERFTSHIKHRNFSKWINKNEPQWKLMEKIDNIYPYDINNPTQTTFADFYIYQKETYE